jgi:hypothetical protein
MAERRSVRTKRRPDEKELAEVAEDELADEPDDELADEPDDELADEPDDELIEEDSGQANGNDGRGPRRRSRRGHKDGLSAARAGQAALRQITELTGKEPEGVTGVDRGEDDGWMVRVEVVEDRRIPSSTDILATYEIELDLDGELMSYRRVRRYPRGRGDNEGV